MSKIKANLSDLAMVIVTLGILLILFIPIPPGLLDFLFIFNLTSALCILLMTFYIDKPLSFSTFPTLLLISTLLRLGLNVSATRLILGNASAGQVIEAIGHTVIQDNYVMGLIVFIILIIVQYVVITNGAQRVAEVAARFTLDSMPGKQMSIDADLNMGLITQDDAKHRRKLIEQEASFYGAMDGASKFVKGDAIAGILIVFVDIIGGLAIGVIQKGMSIVDALKTYTILTIGDGLVTQIPALTISLATGIIVTRAATDAQLSQELSRQFRADPKSLIFVSLGLIPFLFIDLLPKLPVFIMLALTSSLAHLSMRHQPKAAEEQILPLSLHDEIKVQPIEIILASDVYHSLREEEEQWAIAIRNEQHVIAEQYGFILPAIKIRENESLNSNHFQIAIWGQKDKQTPIATHAIKALKDNQHPILRALRDNIIAHLPSLLTRSEVETLLSQDDILNVKEELIPHVLTMAQVTKVLQNLLQEKVSIRYLHLILDVLLEHGRSLQDPTILTEHVRTRLGKIICDSLEHDGNLSVMTLSPELEQALNMAIKENRGFFDPHLTEQVILALAGGVEKMIHAQRRPILLCSSILRRQIRQLTQRIMPQLTIIAMNEIPLHLQVQSFCVVS